MKEKSRLLVKAKPDMARKIMPVPPSAIMMISDPLPKRYRYMLSIGPSVAPMKPVNANTETRPQPLFLSLVVRKSNPK